MFLLLPPFVVYFNHFVGEGGVPTGIIWIDTAGYLSNIRESFDHGFSFFYANPSDPSPMSPKIYFQPQWILAGILWKISGLSIGLSFVLFGFISAFFCIFFISKMIEHELQKDILKNKLLLLIAIWGGGLATLCGFAFGIYKHLTTDSTLFQWLFTFDQGGGWWFLNIGRNFIFSQEAYYHAVFFFSLWQAQKANYRMSIIGAFLLATSSPFAGLGLVSVLFAWSFLEVVFWKNKKFPTYYMYSLLGVFVLIFAYYKGFLGLFDSHKAVESQYVFSSDDGRWLLKWYHMLPAYSLIGMFAIGRIRNVSLFTEFVKKPFNRLCLVWFSVTFILCNHEFLTLKPHQPVHFDRGYVFASLFFIGLPVLDSLLQYFFEKKRCFWGLLFLTFFLTDNTIWFYVNRHANYWKIYSSEKILLDYLSQISPEKSFLVVPHYWQFGMLTTAFTPHRASVSHAANTPDYEKRKSELESFWNEHIVPTKWLKDNLLIVSPPDKDLNFIKEIFQPTHCIEVHDLLHYKVYELTRKIED
jgi:hypothetical protein